MRPLLAPLREAVWLNAERATIAGWMLLAGLVFTTGILVGTSRDGINSRGVPLGGDFTCYFTASWLALRDGAAIAYDHAAMRAAQIEVLGGDYGFLPFFYPPLWLLLCLPLALVPYAVAHAAFVGGTAIACWRGLRALHPERWAALPLLAFPAFWTNATYGQNGFLSAALLAGAAAVAMGLLTLYAYRDAERGGTGRRSGARVGLLQLLRRKEIAARFALGAVPCRGACIGRGGVRKHQGRSRAISAMRSAARS